MGHDKACITGLLMRSALWLCASQCPRDLHWWPSDRTHPIVSYCLIGLQTNSVKPHMLPFRITAVQLVFPHFLGTIGGVCVISNVSLETQIVEAEVKLYPWPFSILVINEDVLCDRQNTNLEMHIWETCSRKVEGITILSDLLAKKLTFNNMSVVNVLWLVFIWHPWYRHIRKSTPRSSVVFDRFILYSSLVRRTASYSWSNNEIS